MAIYILRKGLRSQKVSILYKMPSSLSYLAAEQAQKRESERPRRKNQPAQRPLNKEANIKGDTGTRYSLAERVQALTLHSVGFSTQQIFERIKIPPRTTRNIIQKALSRGYRPEEDPRILNHFVEDGMKSGRPKEIGEDTENEVLSAVCRDRNGREKSTEVLAYEFGISSSSILRILKKHGFSNVKVTRKPGLSEAQRKARLKFCKEHAHWTLEDWKNIIWSDETSVVQGSRRGAQRLWRRSDEAYEKSVIRQRWKGYSEFMFWGCFTYDKKGPCHIYKPETTKDRQMAQKEIDELNEKLEPVKREEWELRNGIKRLGLRQIPGRRPQWNFNSQNGKLTRSKRGGID